MDVQPFENDVEANGEITDWHRHDDLFHVATEVSWSQLEPTLDEEWKLVESDPDMLLLEPVAQS